MAKGKKTGGRKKGTLNRKTAAIRETIHAALEGCADHVITEMNKLKGRELIDAYTKLAEYALPKLQRTSLDIEGEIEIKAAPPKAPKRKNENQSH